VVWCGVAYAVSLRQTACTPNERGTGGPERETERERGRHTQREKDRERERERLCASSSAMLRCVLVLVRYL
jgi:hypothetical protein